jgi:hypothetical protein
MRTEDRVIPDLLCGRDEHLVRDTEAPELRGRQGAAATHRAASVAYAVTGAALTGWPGGTCGYRPISAAHTGVSPVLSPARLCRPPGIDVANIYQAAARIQPPPGHRRAIRACFEVR